ncbi:hypothetical protein L198_05205 [Cryptococcus wingfieldii CBS 7118]|uniref:Uncharacterized protein n=1 Tax=Cryptococcus wingfieldii CBS 7118 TaxID=1295528 RepID=A0A1E3J0K3_9TREE|nr:hypothetical protein L198_05205 [Cryptococcus wingfieldii CBS 7118]ODN94348.1 hypothetical protein L198_05205 [Cryptococcus wingfieldii CBS 7118]
MTKGKTISLATSVNLSDPNDHTYLYTLSRPYPEEFSKLPASTRTENQLRYVLLDSVLRSGRVKRCTMEDFPVSMLKEEPEFAEAEKKYWGMFARSCVGGVSQGATGSIKILHHGEEANDQPPTPVPTTDSAPADDIEITNLGAPSSGTFQERYQGLSPSELSNLVWGETKMKVEEEEKNLPEAKRRARAQLVTLELFDEGFLSLRPTAVGRLAPHATGINSRYSSEPAALTLVKSLADFSPRRALSSAASFWDLMTGKKDEPDEGSQV